LYEAYCDSVSEWVLLSGWLI